MTYFNWTSRVAELAKNFGWIGESPKALAAYATIGKRQSPSVGEVDFFFSLDTE